MTDLFQTNHASLHSWKSIPHPNTSFPLGPHGLGNFSTHLPLFVGSFMLAMSFTWRARTLLKTTKRQYLVSSYNMFDIGL